MIPSEKRKSAAFYLTAAVISMFCFAQTTHCLWLKKTVRQGEQEPNKAAVQTTETQKGRIVFGRVFERDAAVKSQGVDGAEHLNAGVDKPYQADQPGRRTPSWALSEWNLVECCFFVCFVSFTELSCWSKGQERLDASARVAREAWHNMFPNLQCARDHMKFRAVGSGAPHVLVEQGKLN